jgi:hypothetical protein
VPWRGVAATTMRVSPREELLCRLLLVKGCIWTRVSRASTLLLREALGFAFPMMMVMLLCGVRVSFALLLLVQLS